MFLLAIPHCSLDILFINQPTRLHSRKIVMCQSKINHTVVPHHNKLHTHMTNDVSFSLKLLMMTVTLCTHLSSNIHCIFHNLGLLMENGLSYLLCPSFVFITSSNYNILVIRLPLAHTVNQGNTTNMTDHVLDRNDY